MTTVLLIIHLFVTIALIGIVLIQRSEGGGLGIGTSQGMGSFMSGRGTVGNGHGIGSHRHREEFRGTLRHHRGCALRRIRILPTGGIGEPVRPGNKQGQLLYRVGFRGDGAEHIPFSGGCLRLKERWRGHNSSGHQQRQGRGRE